MKTFTLKEAFTGGELSPSLYGRIGFPKYAIGAKQISNFIVRPFGGMVRRGGLEFMGKIKNNDDKVIFLRFIYNSKQQYLIEAGNLYFRFWQLDDNGRFGVVVNEDGNPLEVVTPYEAAFLKGLSYVQSKDVLYLASEKYPLMKLIRESLTDWVLEEVSFNPKISAPFGGYASKTGGSTSKNYTYVVTSLSKDGEESLPTSRVYISNAFSLNSSEANTIHWQANSGAEKYNVYRDEGGIFAFIAETYGTRFVDMGLSPMMDESPPKEVDFFEGEGNYPKACAIFKQRLVLAGTINESNRIWFSRTGIYENFAGSDNLTQETSFNYIIDSGKKTIIKHLITGRDLTILCSDSEWTCSSSSPFAYDTALIRLESHRGAGSISPFSVGIGTVYAGRGDRTVRDLSYSLESDGLLGYDLTLLAGHLFESRKIVSMVYSGEGDYILWCVMSDGIALALTYIREQDVYAWSRHHTKGEFLDCQILETDEGSRCFFLVKRENGIFVEEMTAALLKGDNIENAFYVDSGLKANFKDYVETISGLDHLEGEEVSLLLDGNTCLKSKVQNGAVKLPYKAKNITVGIPYISSFISLPLHNQTMDGTTYGRKRKSYRALIHLENSRGLFAGTKKDNLHELIERGEEIVGEHIPLYSGFKEIPLSSGDSRDTGFMIEGRLPLPLNVMNYVLEEES